MKEKEQVSEMKLRAKTGIKYIKPKLLRLTPHLMCAIGGCNSSGTHHS